MIPRPTNTTMSDSNDSPPMRDGDGALHKDGSTALAIPIDMEIELPQAGSSIGSKPALVLMKGQGIGQLFALAPGANMIGRADARPVQIDLEPYEPSDRVWSSRQHAVIHREADRIVLEDLNSLNGTFVNKTRVHPRQPRPLAVNDIIQIGTVQLKLILI